LKDGLNLMKNDNIIAVGGNGQATIKGFEDFALKLSNHIGKELGGNYLENKSDGAISNVILINIKTTQLLRVFHELCQ